LKQIRLPARRILLFNPTEQERTQASAAIGKIHMKKLRNLIAVMAMMSMAAVLTGCGDDDDDDDDDQPPVNNIVAPATEAELTAPNKTYTVTIPGETNNIILTFPAAGQYRADQGGVIETGSISGATRNVNTWTFNITPDANQEGSQAGSVRLDFTAADQGTFTFTPTEGEVQTGTFALSTNPGGGDDGGNGGGGALSGQTLQLTAPSGAGEKFDFLTDTNVEYEDGAETGTYTWDEANRKVVITLGNGWIFDIDLPAGSNVATLRFFESATDPEADVSNPTYTLGNTP
jgi:hypothetical protein